MSGIPGLLMGILILMISFKEKTSLNGINIISQYIIVVNKSREIERVA